MKNISKKLGIILFLLIFTGCSDKSGDEISVVSESTEFVCSLWEPECMIQREEVDKNPVVLSGNNNIVTITVPQDVCTRLEVDSIEKDDGIVVINLFADGMTCDGGSDLTKIELELSEAVSLDRLEVYKEAYDEVRQVFPVI
ncbi:MAG: hypothetical protein WCT46_02165 [Candidatus Gracilibacteria bacterium]|jgi:hypothetical protein